MSKAKTLSHTQFFHLAEWIGAQRQEDLDGKTVAELARQASDNLDFDVSAYSVGTAASVKGRKWHNPQAKKTDLDTRLLDLAARLDCLEMALTRLQVELGA